MDGESCTHAGRWSASPLLLRCVLLPLHAHILSILSHTLHAQHTTRGFDCDGGASTGVSSRAIKPPGFRGPCASASLALGCSSWGCCTRRGLECRDALIGVRRASCACMHVCRQTAKGCVVVSGVKGHPLHHDQSAGHAHRTHCACGACTRARVASPFPLTSGLEKDHPLHSCADLRRATFVWLGVRCGLLLARSLARGGPCV